MILPKVVVNRYRHLCLLQCLIHHITSLRSQNSAPAVSLIALKMRSAEHFCHPRITWLIWSTCLISRACLIYQANHLSLIDPILKNYWPHDLYIKTNHSNYHSPSNNNSEYRATMVAQYGFFEIMRATIWAMQSVLEILKTLFLGSKVHLLK